MPWQPRVLVCGVMLLAAAASATQNKYTDWSEFMISSRGEPYTGAIKVSGKVSAAGKWELLEIDAFGRAVRLNDEELARLKDYSARNMDILTCPGDADNGHGWVTLYFREPVPDEGGRPMIRMKSVSVNGLGRISMSDFGVMPRDLP